MLSLIHLGSVSDYKIFFSLKGLWFVYVTSNKKENEIVYYNIRVASWHSWQKGAKAGE